MNSDQLEEQFFNTDCRWLRNEVGVAKLTSSIYSLGSDHVIITWLSRNDYFAVTYFIFPPNNDELARLAFHRSVYYARNRLSIPSLKRIKPMPKAPKPAKMAFYAVHVGEKPGVYNSW